MITVDEYLDVTVIGTDGAWMAYRMAKADDRRILISRRSMCKYLALGSLGVIGTAIEDRLFRGAHQAWATEETAAALASAQEQYEQVQAQIDDLSYQYEQMSIQLSDTMDQMEAKQAEIDSTQASIDQTQADLTASQDQLAAIIDADYRNGNTGALDVLLSSADYEELYRNIYYLTKINDAEAEVIQQTKDIKQQLEDQKAQLADEYTQLDSLRADQETQLADMQAQQDQMYTTLSGLSDQVAALTAQYNQELVEQAEAEARARAEAEAAAQAAAEAAAAAQASGGGVTYDSGSADYSYSSGATYGTASASAVINACYSTPSPGSGLCAMWVTNVFSNAGMGYYGGNACDMYASWCYTSDRSSLMPGMIIAVSTHSLTSAGRIYGHIGIYIGNGTVMDNIGYIRSIDVDSWISTYSTTVAARWGWLGGISLS